MATYLYAINSPSVAFVISYIAGLCIEVIDVSLLVD
jgi:hypothetical protein